MFNKNLIGSLEQICNITDTLILKYPVTYAKSNIGNIFVKIPVSKLDPDEFSDIGFNHSLGDFLSFVRIMPDDRDITLNGEIIYAKSNDVSASFITDSLSLLEDYNIDSHVFERTAMVPDVAVFDLTVDDLKRLNNASKVFKNLYDIVLESKDDKTMIYLANLSILNADSNNYTITKNLKADKEFKISVSVEDLNKLPLTDYELHVKYNEEAKKSKYRLVLKSKSLEDFEIILCCNVD